MLEKKRDSLVLIELVDELPEFCQDYLIGRKNERALSTRIGYARDLNHFIDWMIQNHREFCRFEGNRTGVFENCQTGDGTSNCNRTDEHYGPAIV